MPQENFPDNFQVNFPSEFQLVCQVPIQLNSKEGTQLKFQSNFQVPIQVPQQFICQIESSRDPRNFFKRHAKYNAKQSRIWIFKWGFKWKSQ